MIRNDLVNRKLTIQKIDYQKTLNFQSPQKLQTKMLKKASDNPSSFQDFVECLEAEKRLKKLENQPIKTTALVETD